MARILVIDDNQSQRLLSRLLLERAGHTVIDATNVNEAIERIVIDTPDCIVLDHLMIGGSGLVLLHNLQKLHVKTPPIIFASGVMDEELKRNATALGASVCYDKAELADNGLSKAVADALLTNDS